MPRTTQFDLPLLMPSQAQKHVTVNEALTRLDAAAQLRVISSSEAVPPSIAEDGASYLVPAAAAGAWQGRDGHVAVFSNGGWVYLLPKQGWRAWDESRVGMQMFDGSAWTPDAAAVSRNGAAFCSQVAEFDHLIAAGPSNLTTACIPNQALVIGVTGRVITPLVGSGLTGWRIGVSGSDNRYGSGLGLGQNSFLVGLSGSPTAYYADTALVITSEGGVFSAGAIRLAVHFLSLTPPRAV